MRRANEMDLPFLNYLFSETFDYTKDDGIPESSRYSSGQMVMNPNIWIAIEGNIVFVAKPMNSSTYEVHVAMLPNSGVGTIKVGKEAIKWFFKENQEAHKLVAFVPRYRRDVGFFCISCGYKREGKLTQSFIKDGLPSDQIIYGLSREDICQ